VGVYRSADLPRGQRQTALALWRLSDPGNVGTLMRAADAFDAAVALSDGSADPLGPKALRASVGAIFRVPLLPFDEAPRPRVALVAHGGRPLHELDLTGPVTFLLGAEREGLPPSVVQQSDTVASIVTPGAAESLNVATAGAIALYERSRR
jgi:RNA methyltransferase, TrmH family